MIPSVQRLARLISALLLLDVLAWLVHGRDDFILTCGRHRETTHLYMAAINSDQYTRVEIVTSGVPEDATYDPIDDKIYWIESDHQQLTGSNGGQACTISTKICRYNFDSGYQESIVNDIVDTAMIKGSSCRPTPAKIEIDIQSRHIFWVSSGVDGYPELRRATINGTEKTTMSIARSSHPTDLTNIDFDPIDRKLYWSHSYPAALQIFSPDGHKVETILNNEWGVSGVAVDGKGAHIFLTVNGGPDLIQTVDLHGRNKAVLYNNTINRDHNLDPENPVIYRNDIYWIMNGEDKLETKRNLYKMPKSGRQPATLVDTGFNVECLHIHQSMEVIQSEDSTPSADPADYSEPNPWTSKSITSPTIQGILLQNSSNVQYIPISDIEDIRHDKSSNVSKGNKLSGTTKILMYAGFAILVFIIVCLAALVIIVITRRKKRLRNSSVESPPNFPTNPSDEEVANDFNGAVCANVFSAKEVERNLLKFEKPLGSGFYGLVYEATLIENAASDERTRVAVKSLKGTTTLDVKQRFLEEIKLHIEIGSHPNILAILGCVTVSVPYYMITEFMIYGDLLNFLWKCNKKENVLKDSIYDLRDINQLQIARQVAQGMEYLSTTRYYHGDLAARNILVGEDLVVKISDFGMADDIYTQGYKRIAPEKKRPVKWVSLETNTTGQCTIKSDVWSYGIVLYEIYTLGGTPYPGMTSQEVIVRLKDGYRMDKPENCPDQIYQVMRQCWLECPSERPTFTSALRTIDQMRRRYSQGGQYITCCTEMDEPCACCRPPTISVDFNNEDNDAFMPPYVQISEKENLSTSQCKGSRDRVISGEPDELNLWKHLTKKKTTSASSVSSVEFVPDMADGGKLTFI